MRFTFALSLFLLAPPCVHAASLDCLFLDGFDGELAGTPAAWRGNLAVHHCARRTAQPKPDPSMPLLRWSGSLAQTAQPWANQCRWQHSGAAGLGENLYAGAPPHAAHTAAARSWAAEAAWYDYASNTCAPGKVCGHYTQMVWRNTREMGCGIRDCSTGSPFPGFPNWTLVVCNYSPPGNWSGQRPY